MPIELREKLFNTNFDRMISLGVNCQVRYQISRDLYMRCNLEHGRDDFHVKLFSHNSITQPYGAFFFDWIISTVPGIVKAMSSEFNNIYNYDLLKIDDEGHVVHNEYEFRYVHSFPQLIPHSTLDYNIYIQQKTKMEHLVNKTMNAFRDDIQTLYICCGAADHAECKDIANIIRDKYGARKFHVLDVRLSKDPKGLVQISDMVSTFEIREGVKKETKDIWQGDDENWDNIFRKIIIQNLKRK